MRRLLAVLVFPIAVVAREQQDSINPPAIPSQEAIQVFSPRRSNGLVAFTADDPRFPGIQQIFTVQADGHSLRQLTFAGDNRFPSWSADGKTIFFSSDRESRERQIYSMNADGSDQRRIPIEVPGTKFVPNLSPDRTRLVFALLDAAVGYPEVWIADASGANARRLTHTPLDPAGFTWSNLPRFSPDGSRIIYSSTISGSSQIWTMNADGTQQKQVTFGLGPEFPDANAPNWSPDGIRIVFWSGFEGKYGDVWTSDPDGRNPKQLTDQPGTISSDSPACSPDGTRILFDTSRTGRAELWVMDADGEDERRFVDIPIPPDTTFSWQPLSSARRRAVGPKSPSLATAVGNLSVPLLLRAWGSPVLPMNFDFSPAGLARMRNEMIGNAKKVSADRIEDYIGWGVVEPLPEQWDWSAYRDNASAITAAGLEWVPFVWIHNLPPWVRSDTAYVRARCIEHHVDSEGSLSIFEATTVDAYDRFFARLSGEMGSSIRRLRLAAPNDFGEVTYPAGLSTQFFPDRHLHPGFWVDEPAARRSFREAMQQEYGTIGEANRVWETQFASFADIDYPPDASPSRRWLDFIAWYHDAHAERVGMLIDVARRHLPRVEITINLGTPDERLLYGQDLTGVVKMAAQREVEVRTPTGNSVSFFYTKRIATAVAHYGLPGFSSEPADGAASLRDVATAAFKDLTTAITTHFDYPSNLINGQAVIDAERRLWTGRKPVVDAALFFSTIAHRLQSPTAGFEGYPPVLLPWTEALRDVLDYDVVDERLIEDGALERYRVLAWPFVMVTEASTLARIRSWLDAGGVLVVFDLARVSTVEGSTEAFADLVIQPRVWTDVGKGRLFDAGGSLDAIPGAAAGRAYALGRSERFLPPFDTTQDGIWVSVFENGLLVFNTTETARMKSLAVPSVPWRVQFPRLPSAVDLPPLAIRWIDGRTGEVR